MVSTIRLPRLRRQTKCLILLSILLLICIFKKNHIQGNHPKEDHAVEQLVQSNANPTLFTQAHDRNMQEHNDSITSQVKHHPNPTKTNHTSGWSKHMTFSKWNQINAGAVVVNDTDIGPQILNFFELRSDEERDEFVNLHKYSFKLNTDLCKGENTFLAVIIHSAPRYIDRRNRIRTTFGKIGEHRGKRMIYVFIIGDVTGNDDQNKLNGESKINGDIVQGNFFDLYKHLARKHIMAMHWYKEHCNANYVLKLDDDTFINPYNLVDFVLDVGPTGKEMWCKFSDYLEPERKKSKWQTSMEEYPFPVFPQFCQGFAYIVTRQSWLAMYEVSTTNRKISMDDVFVTGILAVKAGIQRYDFRSMLWRCNENRPFIPTGMKKKTILYDPLNRCSKIPFEKWNKLNKMFVKWSHKFRYLL